MILPKKKKKKKWSKGIKFLTNDPSGFQVDISPLQPFYFSILAKKKQQKQNIPYWILSFQKIQRVLILECTLSSSWYKPLISVLQRKLQFWIPVSKCRAKVSQRMRNVLGQLHFYEDSDDFSLYHFYKAWCPTGTLHRSLFWCLALV